MQNTPYEKLAPRRNFSASTIETEKKTAPENCLRLTQMNKEHDKNMLAWLIGIAGVNLTYGVIDLHGYELIHTIPNAIIFISINIIFIAFLGYLFYRRKKIRTITGGGDFSAPQSSNSQHDAHEQIVYTDSILVNNIPPLFCIKDAKGRWLYANQTYLDFFNLGGIDYTGKTNIDLSEFPGIKLQELRFDAGEDKKTWDKGKPRQDFGASKLSIGHTKFDITRIPLYDENKQRLRLFITGIATQQPSESKSKIYSEVFFSSHIPFLLLDSDFKITLVNHSFSSLMGFDPRDVLKKDLFFLEKNTTQEYSFVMEAFFSNNSHQPWSSELNCIRMDGKRFPAKIVISPLAVQHTGKGIPRYVANIFDITQQKLDEKRIAQIAYYDELTELPNRIMFCRRLSETLSAAKRHNKSVAILFINLDRFKTVNDSLGHQAGDILLKEVALRFVKQIRVEDVIARLSGDEFTIMLANEKSHETAIYASTIVAQKIISTLSEHFYIEREKIFIGASIGVAIFPEDATSVESLLKHADIAMHEAKKQGRNTFQFFHKTYVDESKSKHQLESGLRNALLKKELHLYFQPQYITATGELWGAEVLIRWKPGQAKPIPPDYFIPIAEETGLIIPIGKWILETACEQQINWLKKGYNLRQLAVNISARQFMDPAFVEIVEAALMKTGLDAKHLELEITESMLIGDTRRIELQLARIKKMGIKIALDDFGTGYSSLSYLKKFPIDILKIDKSFVKEMTSDSKDERIAHAIIEMGHSLGQKIVAEGVENQMQFDYLRQKGCDIIQGYYFSPPLPLNEMTKLLEDNQGK